MNYANHNLRTQLQEWKNRLSKASYSQFDNALKFLFNNFNESQQISSILKELTTQFRYEENELKEKADHIIRGNKLIFKHHKEQASFNFQFLKYCIREIESSILNSYIFERGSETRSRIIGDYISPIIDYLHDQLDKSNSVVYLLEKYKKRTEWFSCEKLYSEYRSIDKNYEKVLENDLRLFLFDQGIEYPLSGARVGRNDEVDILANVDTDNPIIIEVKVYDKEPPKTYGKNRIKEGFEQSLHYAQKYGKDVYLVIFNMNDIDITFDAEDFGSTFPPSEIVGQKTIYFVVVDVFPKESPSRRKNPKKEMIIKKDLI